MSSYPNPSPTLSNPTTFNGMDPSTWPTQTLTYRFGTFVVQETAETIEADTLTNAGTTITDIVNTIETNALSQVTTQLINGVLAAGYSANIVGVTVDAGYSVITYYVTEISGPPIPKTAYKVWWATYIVYDSNTNLTTVTLPEPSSTSGLGFTVMSYQPIPLMIWVLVAVLAALVAAIAVIEITSWLKSMTTTTNTTTTVNKITNPSNVPVTIQIPGDGTVTIPPGGAYTWTTTSTTTSPNLGGIITVGAVAIGLAGVGIFGYLMIKGAKSK